METKKCTKCGTVKPISEFHKHKNSNDGLQSCCKVCEAVRNKEYRHSFKGLVYGIYRDQIKSSKARGHELPTYSKGELLGYCFLSDKFIRLYNEWVQSGYKKDLVPSIDRLDDYKGYSFDNIQVMTWWENKRKAHNDFKSGKNNKMSRSVIKYDLDGNILGEYYSIKQASRETGVSAGHIHNVCTGKIKRPRNYVWKFKEN